MAEILEAQNLGNKFSYFYKRQEAKRPKNQSKMSNNPLGLIITKI